MNPAFKARWERVRSGRVRILWLVLGALLLVSALPIGLYHRQVLELSQEKLVDTERVQRPGQIRLLDALGVHQLFLAELQYLAVVKASGKRAAQQEWAQNAPKETHAT